MTSQRRVIWTTLGVLAVGLGLLAAGRGLYHLSRARCFAVGIEAICRVETQRPRVALTFDDGPTAAGLDAVLPVLAEHRIQATFFIVGQEMARHPELVRRLVEGGHEIANHSYSHPRMVGRSQRFYDSEIGRTQALLHAAGGRSDLFRPPFAKKLFGLPQSVRRAGLRMVLWDVEDAQTSDPAAFAQHVIGEARPGSIILIHAMNRGNVTARAALPAIVAGLEAKGLEIVPAGELIGPPQGRK